jgi:capsular polysaccharide export protein
LKRSFLFLQGVCSPFFGRLADRLTAEGHQVLKVNFNAGDAAYWGRRPAVAYRGTPKHLPEFLDELYRSYGITDQVLFGDCRPVHRPAVRQAKARDVRVHVFEEGYFRPHWVTLERGGVNAQSPLPRDPDWFRRIGNRVPEYHSGKAFVSPFWMRAAHDVTYHVAGIANPWFFPRYRTHAPANALIEYIAYLQRSVRVRRLEKGDARVINRLVETGTPYYLLPLQLRSDAQIRFHSQFSGMSEVMHKVMASFARHAPPESRLVIKNHPLDTGLIAYAPLCEELAERFDISHRVDFLESGNLNQLLQHARGTVTVNSTVGSVALSFGCPTITLSKPIYDLPGLTFQGELDRFWQHGEKPDGELFRFFRNAVVHTAQINGGFYCKDGIALAVENSIGPLTSDRSPLEELL